MSAVEPSILLKETVEIRWQDEVTVSEVVIFMDMVFRHIKRQEKKCDSLMVNLEYTIPENRLDFQILQA